MRRLVVTQNITLDGSIEMIGDWFDPQGQGSADLSDLQEEMERQDAAADALVLGRQTFEDFRGYWPDQVGQDTTGVAEYLDRVQKYVVSTTLAEPGWANSTILSGDPVTEVGALKRTAGKEIVLTGSITLTHAVVAAGLVDEFRLFVYPAVQGSGRRLFPDGSDTPVELLEARRFDAGIVLLRYAATAA